MRYAAVLAASAAVVGTLAFARDGRGEPAPVAGMEATAPAAARQEAVVGQVSAQEDFRWSGRVARGRQIEIRGIVGDVRAELASGDQVEVVGRRSGDGARHVRIEVVEGEDGVIVCAVYPSHGRWRGSDASRSRADGACSRGAAAEPGFDAEDARVDFTVRVPAGVKFAARTVSGDVHASGLRSPVDVATVSGNVQVATTGPARAASVSGDVEAAFGGTDGEEMEFASVSGDVVLRLGADVGAVVNANTLSGDIDSDFDLRMGSMTDDDARASGFDIRIGRQARGTIGRGGPELKVNTVSGSIRLERGR